MSVNNLLELLGESSLVRAFNNNKTIANISVNQEAYIIASAFYLQPRVILVIKNNLYTAQQLYQKLHPLISDCYLYGCEDSLRVEAIASSPELKAQRMESVVNILNQKPKIIVSHIGAIARYLPKKEIFQKQVINLRVNQELSYQGFKEKLFELGYTLVPTVDQPLVYSNRGSIIDFWPANSDNPIRLEFFGDAIDSIRYFDAFEQTTINSIEQVSLFPASDNIFTNVDIGILKEEVEKTLALEKEKLTSEDYKILQTRIYEDLELIENHSLANHLYRYRCFLSNYSILEYFEEVDIVVSDYEALKLSYTNMVGDTVNYLQELYLHRSFFLKLTHHFDLQRLLTNFYEIKPFYDLKNNIDNDLSDLVVNNEAFKAQLISATQNSDNLLFVVNQRKIHELIESLVNLQKEYVMVSETDALNKPLMIMVADLAQGLDVKFANLKVYSNHELFKTRIQSSKFEKRFSNAKLIGDFTELKLKDYIVHYQHGIGQYLGIVTKKIEGIHKDYLKVIYANDATLYVPIEQFKLIRKFVSSEGARPKLSKLGSGDWQKTKDRISANVEQIAEKLLELYANRSKDIGFVFSADSPLQKQFEDDFIYELTYDQNTAISEIKADMMNKKPMDRLLCGDVGFGKTEVAIRAAFKAVLDQKQVAYLCPTTILSMQHFQTFKDRFENYPVRIEILNRFTTAKEQKRITQKLKNGNVDILIGTHRILSNDVKYHDLGFLIIDEEQRFGVEHKEKIKELKTGIDVLSLSATPIPRTLQMSLIGIRALSQLNTPPQNRLSVQTYVIEKSIEIVIEVIQRELARQGQIFYLHNRIEDIFVVANKLQEKLPEVRFGIAHGKMDKDTIEDTMLKFTNDEYDVLICTTIIETGIDIPNANTIIIDNANNFGLAQLYQIKGRVGRSSSLGYAYLMYEPQKQLTENATKRLKAIKEFAQLGSGYKIAIRDLTIRGAGDLLGPNQSGFINTVGIDLYLELLKDAIAIKKSETKVEEKKADVIKVNKVDGYIPLNFTDYDIEKINLYKEIEKANKLSELAVLIKKTKDLYGMLPQEINLLFYKKKMEILVNNSRVESFKQKVKAVEITFSKEYSQNIDGIKLFTTVGEISKDINLKFINERVIINIPNNIDWLEASILVLERM
ncbi:MAG: transcription-repair coupling factor [Erysipelotrichaceae bacterium]